MPTFRVLATATFAALAACAAAPVGASAACTQGPVTKAFAKYGDTADYSVAPGGTFEAAGGWTLSGGAKVIAGNETIGVTPGSKSLMLPVGSTATSPEFCVDETNPYFRFAMKANHNAGYLAVVLYRNASGQVTQAQFTSSSFSGFCEGKWIPSAVSPLAAKIPLTSGTTASVQIKFVSTGNPLLGSAAGKLSALTGGQMGSTLIDSVMVDPYRRG